MKQTQPYRILIPAAHLVAWHVRATLELNRRVSRRARRRRARRRGDGRYELVEGEPLLQLERESLDREGAQIRVVEAHASLLFLRRRRRQLWRLSLLVGFLDVERSLAGRDRLGAYLLVTRDRLVGGRLARVGDERTAAARAVRVLEHEALLDLAIRAEHGLELRLAHLAVDHAHEELAVVARRTVAQRHLHRPAHCRQRAHIVQRLDGSHGRLATARQLDRARLRRLVEHLAADERHAGDWAELGEQLRHLALAHRARQTRCVDLDDLVAARRRPCFLLLGFFHSGVVGAVGHAASRILVFVCHFLFVLFFSMCFVVLLFLFQTDYLI